MPSSKSAPPASSSTSPTHLHDPPPSYSSLPLNPNLNPTANPNTNTATIRSSTTTTATTTTTTTPSLPQTLDPYLGLSTLSFPPSSYTPAHSKLSDDRVTLTVTDPSLLKSPSQLLDFVHSQTKLPPIPQVRIKGGQVFDFTISLVRYLRVAGGNAGNDEDGDEDQGERREDSTWNEWQVTTESVPSDAAKEATGGAGGGGGVGRVASTTAKMGVLHRLAAAFCKDQSPDKAFILTRAVANWDQSYLSGAIRTLLAELQYAGPPVEITFPVVHQRVVVTPESNLLGRFLAFFNTRPGGQYAAVRCVWRYASAPPPTGAKEVNRHAAREFATRSEHAWWSEWAPVIEKAVLERRKGRVGLDDLLEVRMGFLGPRRPLRIWGNVESN